MNWVLSSRLSVLVAALASAVCSFLNPAAAAQQTGRDWTLEDSIRVRYFVGGQLLGGGLGSSQGIQAGGNSPVFYSADRQYLFLLSQAGDLACDCNVSTMHIFATAALRRSLAGSNPSFVRPLGAISMRSGDGRSAIDSARWSGAGEINFVGTDDRGVHQAFLFDPRSARLRQITQAASSVSWFEYRTGTAVFATAEPLQPFWQGRPAVSLGPVEFGQLSLAGKATTTRIYVTRGGRSPTLMAGAAGLSRAWIAPDGRSVAIFAQGSLRRGSENHGLGDGGQAAPTFSLVRLHDDGSTRTIEIPAESRDTAATSALSVISPTALWTDDSAHIVLVGSADNVAEAPIPSGRPSSPSIVDVELATGRSVVLAPLETPTWRVTSIAWLSEGRRFAALRQRPDGAVIPDLVFSRAGTGWTMNEGDHGPTPSLAGPSPDAIRVSLSESPNDAPQIVAERNGRRISLSGPDPSIAGIRIAPSEEVTWIEPSGERENGGLVLPLRRGSHRAPPLVINAYYYDPTAFRPDGPQFAGYATQALAAHGIAVLNINIPNGSHGPGAGPGQGAFFAKRIQAAVASLAARDLIDPQRIGIIGFSRGGFLSLQAITHPTRLRIAAAVVNDGFMGDYSNYLRSAATAPPNVVRDYERQYGGPFWQNLDSWLENETTFNVRRVTTPLLYTIHLNGGPQTALIAAPLAGAFRRNGRPIEVLMFPNGQHQLQRPSERLAAMRATVDWMRFWLMGEIDSDPRNRDQYQRWMAMRSQQQGVLQEERRRGESVPDLVPLH